MSYIEESLSAGEKVEAIFRFHWVALYEFLRLKYTEQGVFGRILAFGAAKITGRGISDLVYRTIDDPMSVQRRIKSVSHPAG